MQTEQHPVCAGPIVMHTDGSCLANPGPMGWAFHIRFPDGETTEHARSAPAGTNNVAELMAAIDGLRSLPLNSTVTIITDSDYLRLGATRWLGGWIEKNWRNAQKKPVKNKGLWVQLRGLMEDHTVTFERVPGHSGDPINDRVDFLAREAAKKQKG